MKIKRKTAIFCFVAACMALAGFGQSVQGGLLDLAPHAPDIFSDCTDISYDASTDSFSVWGIPETIDDDGNGPAIDITSGVIESEFILDATIDESGTLDLTATRTIEIKGYVSSLGYNSGTLLTGTLTDFAFYYDPNETTSGFFEILFDVTGGDAHDLYASGGGVILYMGPNNRNYDGDFNNSFDNFDSVYGYGDGVSDTFAQPEPGSLSLLMLGLMASVLRTRARLH